MIRTFALLAAIATLAVSGCRRSDDPRATLARYFDTAVRQDYAATYDCYEAAYRAKVSREEYARHRRDASPLQGWRLVSFDRQADRAWAEVALTFGPWAKAGRAEPTTTTVREELVHEGGDWRVRVW